MYFCIYVLRIFVLRISVFLYYALCIRTGLWMLTWAYPYIHMYTYMCAVRTTHQQKIVSHVNMHWGRKCSRYLGQFGEEKHCFVTVRWQFISFILN